MATKKDTEKTAGQLRSEELIFQRKSFNYFSEHYDAFRYPHHHQAQIPTMGHSLYKLVGLEHLEPVLLQQHN